MKYLSSKEQEEAVAAVKEMKAPKHFVPEMLRKLVVTGAFSGGPPGGCNQRHR